MIAWPFSSRTLEMSPTRTPETRTVWPWPGVTACPVWKTPSSWNGFFSRIGMRSRWFCRIT